MRLSKRTEYGMRAVVQLARHWPQSYMQSRDLSQKENLPGKFLESILLALRRGGFLESKIGREGGYRLARAPKEIRVGDLIRRLEGRLSIKDTNPGTDVSPGEIAVHMLNENLTTAMDHVLDQMTLEQLLEQVNKAAGSSQEMYYI